MKTEFKISTVSIVCALGMLVFGVADAAAPVRALGGAGTYSSATSAATAKSTTAKPASAATTSKISSASTRAGVMRVLPKASTANKNVSTSTSTSGTAVTGTRVSASPRLSIGKYVPNRVVNKPTVDTASKGDFKELEVRVQDLENNVFYNTDSLEKRLIALSDKVELGQKDLTTELADIDATFVTVNESITAVEKSVSGLSDDFAAEKAAMTTAVENIRTSIEEVKNNSSTDFTDVRNNIANLQTGLTALTARVANLESGKQDVLKSTKYITVTEDDNVELNLDVLTEEINSKIGTGDIASGVTIDYIYETNSLEWRFPGEEAAHVVRFGDIFVDPDELKVADDAVRGLIAGIDERVKVLESKVGTLEGTVGTGEMTVGGTAVSTIIDAVKALDVRADKIASDSGKDNQQVSERVTALETTVDDTTKGVLATYQIATQNAADIEAANNAIDEVEIYGQETREIADSAIPNITEAADETDGKYVLTAEVAGDTTTYKWEKIARDLFETQ